MNDLYAETTDILLSIKNKVPTSNTYNYLGVILSNANDRFGENYENKHGKAFVRYMLPAIWPIMLLVQM